MNKRVQIRHRVVLYVLQNKDNQVRPMTEKQMKRWIEEHFKDDMGGYAESVRVVDVINEESK